VLVVAAVSTRWPAPLGYMMPDRLAGSVLSGAGLESPPVSPRAARRYLRHPASSSAPFPGGGVWVRKPQPEGLSLSPGAARLSWRARGEWPTEAGDAEGQQPDPFHRAAPTIRANEALLFEAPHQFDHPTRRITSQPGEKGHFYLAPAPVGSVRAWRRDQLDQHAVQSGLCRRQGPPLHDYTHGSTAGELLSAL
jgi:hypothetical protein